MTTVATAPKPVPPAEPFEPAATGAIVPLWRKVMFSGRPYLCQKPTRARRDSENAQATPAVIRYVDGREDPAVAIFLSELGPRAVISIEAATRLADQLDNIIATHHQGADS